MNPFINSSKSMCLWGYIFSSHRPKEDITACKNIRAFGAIIGSIQFYQR